jgi:hypothetical protein
MFNKKLILILTFIGLLSVGVSSVFANQKGSPVVTHNHTLEHIIFTESGIVDGNNITSSYEVWYNENGEYRMNTILGPFVGDYEVWDGSKYYQYTKVINELAIRNVTHDNGHGDPIPNLLLSKEIKNRVKNDIENGKIKKSVNNSKEFSSQDDSQKVEFDTTDSFIKHSVHKENGVVTHELNLDLTEKIENFDLKLLQVDQSNVNVINID